MALFFAGIGSSLPAPIRLKLPALCGCIEKAFPDTTTVMEIYDNLGCLTATRVHEGDSTSIGDDGLGSTFTYRSNDRTLKSEGVDEAHANVLAAIPKLDGVKQR